MLRKITREYVIPGVAAVTAQPASVACAVPPPTPTDPNAPPPTNPPTSTPKNGDIIFVYVPKYFTVYTNEETRTQSVWPPPAGYTATTGIFYIADPMFPNSMSPVYETRAYWNYP